MSNEKEIIDELQECLDIGDNDRIALYPEEVRMCIETLEKQIAKKPRIIGVSDYAEYMKCPQCRLTTALYSNMRPDYCPKCGQKLDWGD